MHESRKKVPSDPELENQINDRILFKEFVGMLPDKLPSDHSTFSRFRSRISKEAMIELNSEVLREFAKKDLSLDEGIATDPGLVKWVSYRLKNDELEKEQKERKRPEGQMMVD